MFDLLLGAVAGAILVVLVVAVSQVTKLGQSLSTLNQSVSALSKTVTEIQQSLGRPNGGDPDWPHFDEAGKLAAKPPRKEDHKTIADVLRGVYCGNAYTVQLLDRRLK